MSAHPLGTGLNHTSECPTNHLRPALVQYFRRRCGNIAEAEDLAQDVLLRMVGRNDWESPEHVEGYVFRAAANRWLDRQRRTAIRGVVVEWSDEGAHGLSDTTTPERVSIQHQELDSAASALLELNERTRDIFVLVRLEHMKQRAVANMLGISLSAVEKHLVKAMTHLLQYTRRKENDT